MADKKKTLKTYKTAAGAQQYGDADAWRSVDNRVRKDFLNMSPEEFKEKYGVEQFRAMARVWAGSNAAKSKEYKELGAKGAAKVVDSGEKELLDRSKKSGYTKGGMAKKNGYAPGGLVQANCGASMKPNRTARK